MNANRFVKVWFNPRTTAESDSVIAQISELNGNYGTNVSFERKLAQPKFRTTPPSLLNKNKGCRARYYRHFRLVDPFRCVSSHGRDIDSLPQRTTTPSHWSPGWCIQSSRGNSTLQDTLSELIIPAIPRKNLVLCEKALICLGLCYLIARVSPVLLPLHLEG